MNRLGIWLWWLLVGLHSTVWADVTTTISWPSSHHESVKSATAQTPEWIADLDIEVDEDWADTTDAFSPFDCGITWSFLQESLILTPQLSASSSTIFVLTSEVPLYIQHCVYLI